MRIQTRTRRERLVSQNTAFGAFLLGFSLAIMGCLAIDRLAAMGIVQ